MRGQKVQKKQIQSLRIFPKATRWIFYLPTPVRQSYADCIKEPSRDKQTRGSTESRVRDEGFR